VASVQYIDYGNEDYVPLQSLRQLPDSCWDHRPMAVPCRACSFSPANPGLWQYTLCYKPLTIRKCGSLYFTLTLANVQACLGGSVG